jgi:dihydrodipicolinate synthase/N-acetylneuraminate lyase
MLRGAIAAALTPLAGGGATVDEEAFGPYVDFLAENELDGLLALGTTGEGVLLDVEERQRVASLYIEASAGRLQVAVHCGAQSTGDTVALASHAAEIGADAVAVIAPPYFAFDAGELLTHFSEAARACDPLPFYVYEFAARSGYAVPLEVIAGLREEAGNFVGLKVSDTPWERFEPYVVEGLDIFVGPEALIPQGFAAGAAGAVSGLAGSFPDAVVRLVRDPTPEAAEPVAALRASLQALPFQAASKAALGLRGVPVRGSVRAPLRSLTPDEQEVVKQIVRAWLA